MVLVLFMVNAAVPPLIDRQVGELLSVVLVIVIVPLGVVSASAEDAAPAAVTVMVSIVRPLVFVPVMSLAVALMTLRPLTVLPLLSVMALPAVFLICGLV